MTAGPAFANQVVAVLAPLRSGADGTHQLTIVLRPDGLGTVQATVTVSGDVVDVHLATDSALAHQALSQSMGDLRDQLQQGGGRATVSLQTSADGQAGGRQPRSGPWPGGAAAGSRRTGTARRGADQVAGVGAPSQLVDLWL